MNDKDRRNNSKIARRSLCLSSNQSYQYDESFISSNKSMTRSKSSKLSKSQSTLHLEEKQQQQQKDDLNKTSTTTVYKRTLLSRATVTPMASSTVLKRFSSIDGGGNVVAKSSLKPSKTSIIKKTSNHDGAGGVNGGNFRLGQRVSVPSLSLTGTIRFCGETRFKTKGQWLGLELDEIGKGKNDGSVQGERYFTCPPNTGLFILASKAIPIEDTNNNNGHQKNSSIFSTSPQVARSSKVHQQQQQQQHHQIAPTSASTTTSRKNSIIPNSSKSTSIKRRSMVMASTARATSVPKKNLSATTITPQPSKSARTAAARSTMTPQCHRVSCISSTKSTSISSKSSKRLSLSSSTSTRISSRTFDNGSSNMNSIKYTSASSASASASSSTTTNTTVTTKSSTTKSFDHHHSLNENNNHNSLPRPRLRASDSLKTITTAVSNNSQAELQRMQELLERSREEQRVLSEQMNGKEAAWERLVSAKESYALLVTEKEGDISRLKSELELAQSKILSLEKTIKEKELGLEKVAAFDSMEKQHQKVIERLEGRIRTIQEEADISAGRHNYKARESQAQIDHLRRQISEYDDTISNLEREASDMRQSRKEEARMYEATIESLKKEHAQVIYEKDLQIQRLQGIVSDLSICQTPTTPRYLDDDEDDYDDFGNERNPRRRLEIQLDLTTAELDRERQVIKTLSAEIGQLKDEIKRLHRLSMSSSSQYYFLQTELENEVNDKRRIMEEANVALELQARFEEENESIRLAHEKTQKSLAEALKKIALMEKRQQQQQLDSEKNDISHSDRLEHLQKESHQLEAENQKLQESQKQAEQECMRLMDELLAFEKVESERIDDKKDDRMLRREIEQLRSLAEREKKRYEELEHEKKSKIEKLNKELSDLESLVENKVFHESELEAKLEDERQKVLQLELRLRDNDDELKKKRNKQHQSSDIGRRGKKSVPISPTSPKSAYPFFFKQQEQKRSSTSSSTLVTINSFYDTDDNETRVEDSYCEICESYGHEVMSCTALGNVIQYNEYMKEDIDQSSCYCVNCDVFDTHPTEECPNQEEMF